MIGTDGGLVSRARTSQAQTTAWSRSSVCCLTARTLAFLSATFLSAGAVGCSRATARVLIGSCDRKLADHAVALCEQVNRAVLIHSESQVGPSVTVEHVQ